MQDIHLGCNKLKRNNSGQFYINKDTSPNEEDIRLWLSDRVFPKERQGANQILESLGLSTYDSWEIAKKTHAISLNDFYWMSDNLEDTFENINSYHAAFEQFNGFDITSASQAYIKQTNDFEDFEETNEKLPIQWDK
ncbi:hypothetical protein [Paenibacillus sp. JGP012]|uniref:hypothetical protein n=1 Tax=Paenibacillus sp. JGP012 TaxID=2735914 RepID=UPI00161585CA|nr:hypothetical protein [Paenibacillus sp. JGP012]